MNANYFSGKEIMKMLGNDLYLSVGLQQYPGPLSQAASVKSGSLADFRPLRRIKRQSYMRGIPSIAA
jgi:hypothetical protein